MIIKLKKNAIIDHLNLNAVLAKEKFKKKRRRRFNNAEGIFKLDNYYYRSDRVPKPVTKLKSKVIKKNMGWCNDVNSKYYNRKIIIKKKIKHEKMFRTDYNYDFIIPINYNFIKPISNKGSSNIFTFN